MTNDGSKRYIVAYPYPDSINEVKLSVNKSIYFYKKEAETAAKFIGGWVIEVDITKSKV